MSMFSPPPDDFSVGRLRWLIHLRWIALAGILVAGILAWAGFYPGVHWPVLLGSVAVAGFYNLLLWVRQREEQKRGEKEAVRQAITDMGLLTVVLWAAGGMRTPFIGYYVFHVAIVGILGGRRGTIVASVAALFGSGLLLITEHVPALQIGRWDPLWPWDVLAELVAFGTTVGSVAYLVTHAATELRARERALAEARDRAALELEVLTNTLDELEAGLEVVDRGGGVLWRNKRAEELAPHATRHRWSCPGEERPCESDVQGVCPVASALDEGGAGQCRFAADVDGEERVYEMQVFPLGPGRDGTPRVMNLYVDRTSTLLAERRLIFAERLASLGRVTQGVAHELNTPLATIRTLAADMAAALRAQDATPSKALLEDLRESAALVHDETRRLGRITQGLLTGRDLTASQVEGVVPLSAVVERAQALVFSGGTRGVDVDVAEGLADLEVQADPDHLVQVLVNLLQNAADAVREKSPGRVFVSGDRVDDRVHLHVDDDGAGIDPAMTGRLFEPFATSKPPGEGTGLGLYTSYMLVAAMNGRMTLTNREAGGARATVELDAAAPLVELGVRRPMAEAS
jgi:C4-dicarboxylate-specific signal transduction histidine kinase